MNCQQINKLILPYCDNTLPPELRTEFIQHIKECPSCKNALKLTVMENQVLKSNDDIPSLPDDFTSRIMGAIQQRQDAVVAPIHHEPEKSTTSYYKRGLVITSAVLAAALAIFLILPGRLNMPGHVDIAENSGVPQQITVEEENNTQFDKEEISSELSNMADAAKNEAADSYSAPANPAENMHTEKLNISENQDIPNQVKANPARALVEENASSAVKNKQRAPSSSHLYLQPVNIPPSYELAQIISDENDNLTFVYKSTDKELTIHLSPVQLGGSNERVVMLGKKAETYEDTVDEGNNYSGGTSIAPIKDNSMYILTWAINKGNMTYNVTLTSNMSQKKLSEIASSIDFKEGNLNGTKD